MRGLWTHIWRTLLTPWGAIVAYAGLLHTIWGVLLLINPAASFTTTLDDLVRMFGDFTPWVLFTVAWIPLIYTFTGRHKLWWLTIPQMFVLFISMRTAIDAIAESAFADGVVRAREFIAADQMPALLLFILYTAAVIAGVWDRRDKD